MLTLEKEGRSVRLTLRESRVKDGRITVEGTLTLLDDKRSQGVHASFFLGEEQVFPLKPGLELHLLAERMPDGMLLYHPRFVTRTADGRVTTEAWPNMMAPAGMEFSIRNGEVGFSFKA